MEQPKKPPRSYKGLKQKQKAKISDYMYLETQRFFQANGKMPGIDEDYRIIALEFPKNSLASVSAVVPFRYTTFRS